MGWEGSIWEIPGSHAFQALLTEPSAHAYAERHDNIEAIYKKLGDPVRAIGIPTRSRTRGMESWTATTTCSAVHQPNGMDVDRRA